MTEYNTLKAALEKRARQREYWQDQLAATVGGEDYNQIVSGRVVPYSPIQGMAKIAKALMARQGIDAADAKEKEINEQIDANRERATQSIIDQYFGREGVPQSGGPLRYGEGEMYQEFQPEVPEIKADKVKAAIMAIQNPYTQELGKSLLSSEVGNQRSPYINIEHVTTADGKTIPIKVDHRTGDMWYLTGEPYTGQTPKGHPTTPKFDPNVKAELSYADQSAAQQAKGGRNPIPAGQAPVSEAELAGEKITEEGMAKRELEKPTDKINIENGYSQAQNVGEHIEKAISQASVWTTGFLGQVGGFVGGTPQHNLAQTLSTIKSSIGLEALQALRASGGTLGQVTEAEHRLLQDKWTTLANSQSEEQLVANLKSLKKQIESSWRRVQLAYELKHGEKYEPGKQPTDVPDSQQKPQDPAGIR